MTPAQEALVLAAWRAGDEGVEVKMANLTEASQIAWRGCYGRLRPARQGGRLLRFALVPEARALMALAAKAGEGKP